MNKIKLFFIGLGILLIDFFPQIFLRRAFFNGDPVWSFYPTFSFYKAQLLAHQSFFWTKGILSGFPLFLDLSGGFYSPLNFVLFKYLSVITAYNIALFIGIGLLFLCTYLFLRQLDISEAGSLLASIAFTFGYQISNWSNNLVVVNALFVLPLLLLCISKINQGKFWWIFIGGAGLGYAFLTGQPQWILMSFICGLFYYLFLSWPIKSLSWDKLKLFLGFVLMIIIGVSIASFQLIPSSRFSLLSSRVGGISFTDAQVSSQTPLDWIWYLLPELQVRFLSASEPTLYVGIIPLILAILAIITLIGRDKKIKFLTFLFLFGLVTALKYSPIFWLIHKLPVFSLFRGSNRWMYIGNLGLVAMAGIGFDSLKRGDIPKKFLVVLKNIFTWIVSIVVSIAIIGNIVFYGFSKEIIGFLQNYFDKNIYEHTTKLPLQHYHDVVSAIVKETFNNINFLNIKFILPLIFIVIGYLLIKLIYNNNNFLHNNLSIIIVGLSAFNLISLSPNFYQTIPRSILETEPKIASFINNTQSKNNFRVFSVLNSSAFDQKLFSPDVNEYKNSDGIEFMRDTLEPNMSTLYGIDTIDGYNNLMSLKNAHILAFLGSHRTTYAGGGLAYTTESLDKKIDLIMLRLPVLSMMNVKYLISAYELPKTSNLKLVYSTFTTRFNVPIYLYENERVLPRIFLANHVNYLTPENNNDNFDVIVKEQDFNRNTYLDCNNCDNLKNIPSNKDSITISKYQDGFLSLSANINNGRWLVFSESNLPGWQATIDGQPVSIYTANYLYQGVYVPKGKHDIRFEYKKM